jgi:phage/plasmid-associated DNA primase
VGRSQKARRRLQRACGEDFALPRQGTFTPSRLCNEALDVHRDESNPARVFLVEHYRADEGGFELSADLYTLYGYWARDNGHALLNGSQFGQEIKRAFPSAVRKRRHGQWGYERIRSQSKSPLSLAGGKGGVEAA